ncbi:cytochrome P450 [Streptomyces sp. NPDC086554]|uniref:cytochrome P450 n=1 Tax=Streptomyces sp. NPDC086554 TaxID=3154864 RepID=UPI00344972EF
MTPASPPPGPRLPAPLQTALFLAAPGRFTRAAQRRYGPAFQVRFLGFPPEVLVTNAELAAEIYTVDAGGGRAGEVRRQFLEPMVGKHSLLSLDGDPWWRHRRLLSPPLHGRSIARYRQEIADIAATEIARWPHDRPFVLRDSLQSITLEVILRLVFGIRDAARLDRLRALIPELIEVGGSAALLMTPPRVSAWTQTSPVLRRMTFLPTTRFLRVRDAVDAILYEEIARRRREPVPGATDVLSRLLEARDEDGTPLGDQELRDELITLLEAGHETTATGLAWAFERLLRTPDVLAKLHAELELGADERYLDAVVKEALRSRPVVYDAPRLLDVPLKLGAYEVPAGWYAGPLISLIHRDPDAFPQPDEFRPERFLGDEAARAQQSWMPFGGGRRYCVGAQLALLEMKVIIREVLERTDLTVPDPAPEKPRMRHVTLVPARGTRVVARRENTGGNTKGSIVGRRRTVTVREEIAASPDVVWAALADVTRMGEWSPECTGGRWIGGATRAAAGARFEGANRKDRVRWTTRCAITLAEPGRALAWEVKVGVPLSRWSFTLTPTESGTLVEQTWRDLRVGPFGALAARLGEAGLRTGPRADHNERGMRATLTALKQHLESARTTPLEPATA